MWKSRHNLFSLTLHHAVKQHLSPAVRAGQISDFAVQANYTLIFEMIPNV